MRPTGRGLAVVAVLAASLAMAWAFGPRALNAVVAPLAVALVAGLVTVVWSGRPAISRQPVAAGFPGERRTVSLVADLDRATAVRIDDAVGDGLSATGNVATTTLSDAGYSYELELERRGEHEVGPLSVTVTDALGLVRRQFEPAGRDRVLVYPRVHELRGDGTALYTVLATDRETGRGEFDHLREYERGDPLRDVHWTASARRADDELLVRAYAAGEDVRTVTVAAEAQPGRDDEMATATASVATALLEGAVSIGVEGGVEVEVITPAGTRASAAGRDDRGEILGLLATADAGELAAADRREADVLVRAGRDGTVVVVGERELPFEELRGAEGPDRPGSDGGVIA